LRAAAAIKEAAPDLADKVGKSSLAAVVVQRLAAVGYQFCLIDPEGDYQDLSGAVVLGGVEGRPEIAEVARVLEDPDQNVVVNLLAISLDDRPRFFCPFAAPSGTSRARCSDRTGSWVCFRGMQCGKSPKLLALFAGLAFVCLSGHSLWASDKTERLGASIGQTLRVPPTRVSVAQPWVVSRLEVTARLIVVVVLLPGRLAADRRIEVGADEDQVLG